MTLTVGRRTFNYHCSVCGQGPEHGVSVYRVNDKGQVETWACVEHQEQVKLKPKSLGDFVWGYEG